MKLRQAAQGRALDQASVLSSKVIDTMIDGPWPMLGPNEALMSSTG